MAGPSLTYSKHPLVVGRKYPLPRPAPACKQDKRPDLVDATQFLSAVSTKDIVVCHVFEEGSGISERIDMALASLWTRVPFSAADFVRLPDTEAFGMVDQDQLPAVLFYREGELRFSFMRATDAQTTEGAEEMLLKLGFETMR